MKRVARRMIVVWAVVVPLSASVQAPAAPIVWGPAQNTSAPGDILATGTNHRGLNPFMDGDVIELEVEGLGRLKINIQDELKRTWARVTRLQHAEKGGEGVQTPLLT